ARMAEGVRGIEGAKLRLLVGAIEAGIGFDEVVERVARLVRGDDVTASRRRDDRTYQVRVGVDHGGRRDHHELGVSRCAVVVDAKRVGRNSLALQRHALRVPERGRRIDHGADGVRLEVENEGRSLKSARFSTAAAGRQRGHAGGGRQQRDDPLHRSAEPIVRAMAEGDDHLLAYIEIPKGSRNKYEYDEELEELVLDRFLSSSTVYPTDYGYLIGHRGRDGDPLDAMVCVSEPTFPGCVIRVKPIALFKMWDEKGEDDKVVCVPLNDPGWNQAETLEDIPPPVPRAVGTSTP